MAAKSRKKKSTTNIHTIRQSLKQDNSPSWNGAEEWIDTEFRSKFHEAMQYYNLMLDKKESKRLVIKWMTIEGYDVDTIRQFKKVKDWRCNSTISGLISCVLNGMPVERSLALGNHDIKGWISNRIVSILEDSKQDISEFDDDDQIEEKPKVDKNEEIVHRFISEFDDIVEKFYKNQSIIIKVDELLREYNIKHQHVATIKSAFASISTELQSVVEKTCDEQIKEAYSSYPIKLIRSLYEIYLKLFEECDKLVENTNIKKPRAAKPISKEKMVAKLKFKSTDEKLGLSSIDPITIIGATELFLYDTKTRKLYRFVGKDGGLSVNGTSIDNYDSIKSIGKTLLKPVEQLTKFKNSGKLALKTFIDDIDTLDIKASGKLTENQVLLKAL